jgi:hypothetical protein
LLEQVELLFDPFDPLNEELPEPLEEPSCLKGRRELNILISSSEDIFSVTVGVTGKTETEQR